MSSSSVYSCSSRYFSCLLSSDESHMYICPPCTNTIQKELSNFFYLYFFFLIKVQSQNITFNRQNNILLSFYLYTGSYYKKKLLAKWMQDWVFLAYSSIRKLQWREERLYIPNHLSYPLCHYYCLHFPLHFRVYSKWNININFFLLHESSDNLG